MKVKEIARTANVAWSPAAMQSIHVACGTVAQQLDATFRCVEIQMNFSNRKCPEQWGGLILRVEKCTYVGGLGQKICPHFSPD